MRAHVKWTPELDTHLRRLRSEGLTWDRIAAAMSLGRNTVLERARKIGANGQREEVVQRPIVEAEHRDRLTLPAGHPSSWTMLNAGTVLENVPYLHPVFR